MKGRFGNDNSSDNHTSILAGSKFKNSEDAEDEMFEEHETIHTTSQRIIKTKKGGEGRLGDRDKTQERSFTFPSQLNL